MAVTVVLVNWLVLLALPAIKWQGDDLIIGGTLAIATGAISAALGRPLGDVLAGIQPRAPRLGISKKLAIAGAIAVMTVPLPAGAHEVGGDAGKGVISWTPGDVAPGEEVQLRIEDLEVTSGADTTSLRLEAWRAEHRIRVPLDRADDAYVGTFSLPEEGPWMLLLWVRAGEDLLLTTQQMDVARTGHEPSRGTHRESFTLGLNALAESDPPRWLDVIAYAIAAGILALLLRGLLRSLRRLAVPSLSGGG